MDASAWIALASLAGVVMVNAVVVAFLLGGMFQRVHSLEAAVADHRTTSDALIRLEGEVKSLTNQIANLAAGMDWIVRVPGHPAGQKPTT